MSTTAAKPRVTSLAPQFLVDDLYRAIAYYRDALGFTFGEPGYCQMSLTGDSQAAGCCLAPSTKTVPLTTSGRSVDPFNARHFFDADSINL